MHASSPPSAHPSRPLRFLHRGEVIEISELEPECTVLQWLREHARHMDTKEGCNEGDCGACTVVLADLDTQGELRLSSVNACIQLLPTLDGKALFTAQDVARLAAPDQVLHPVQQALVDCHGSQCGFCTPGFVMSLWHGYEQHQQAGTRPSRQQLADSLSGNLCRCTGYRPILDAGEQMFDRPPAPLDRPALVATLQQLQADAPLHLQAPSGAQFHAPRSLAALAALRADRPQALLLAGATDIGLWVTKQLRRFDDIIYLGRVPELQAVERRGDRLWVGAAVPLEQAWAALTEHAPALRELWLRFAAPPLRHAGTLVGNLANGSPIGDGAPALMALDAVLELNQGGQVRDVALDDFYLDYMKNALQPGEFVQAVSVPLAAFERPLRAYKISKRFDCDISAVSAGFALDLEGQRVREVRLAFGGMAATVRRARRAEAALLGQAWTEATLQAAQQALAEDFTPLSDMRASAAHRLRVAQNLLQRLWLETRPDAPLSPQQTRVFALDAR